MNEWIQAQGRCQKKEKSQKYFDWLFSVCCRKKKPNNPHTFGKLTNDNIYIIKTNDEKKHHHSFLIMFHFSLPHHKYIYF